MAQEKIYRWFRFYESFADDHKFICNRENGNALLGMYTRLLALSLENNGIIKISINTKITDTLSALVNEPNLTMVRKLVSVLTRFDYMKRLDSETLFFPEGKELTGKESEAARRMRRVRNRKNLSDKSEQCSVFGEQCSVVGEQCSLISLNENSTISNLSIEHSEECIEHSKECGRTYINEKVQKKKASAPLFNSRETNLKMILKVLDDCQFVNGSVSNSPEEWSKIIGQCLDKSNFFIVNAAAEICSKSKGKISNKVNYFKRIFQNVNKDPERYIPGYQMKLENYQNQFDELVSIVRTPWLSTFEKGSDEDVNK